MKSIRKPKTVFAVILLLSTALASKVYAEATQEDVFKSISDNMGEKSDSGHFLAILMTVAAVVILAAVLSKRKPRVAIPKALNHQGKLLKEVLRASNLKPAEARLLKSLGESQSVDNSLVMLLCPSVLEKALRQKNGKYERKLATQLAKKAGLIPARAK